MKKNRKKNDALDMPGYDPNALIDFAIEKLGLKNDAALSHALKVAPPVISKARNKVLPIGASLLIRLSEALDMRTLALKAIAGMA